MKSSFKSSLLIVLFLITIQLISAQNNTKLECNIIKTGITINGTSLKIPGTVSEYVKVLGNPSRTVNHLMGNDILVWDNIGLIIRKEKTSDKVKSLNFSFVQSDFVYTPTHMFSGKIKIGNSILDKTTTSSSLKNIGFKMYGNDNTYWELEYGNVFVVSLFKQGHDGLADLELSE